MELKISHHSSFRVPATIPRLCNGSSHDIRLMQIEPTTKKFKYSLNCPSKCSTKKLVLPVGFYGERFSKFLISSRPKHNSFRACSHGASVDSTTPVLAKAQDESDGHDSILAKVLRLGSASYNFARPVALRQAVISTTCLYTRVFVENPQLFKWSLLLKAFPGLITMLLANAYYVGVNQIYDADIDRVNKPDLPIPAGYISLKQAWFVVTFELLAGLLILRLMNADVITTSLYCLGLFFGTLYSVPPFRFKGSSVATIIVLPLISIIKNVGVLYATRASLGLAFWWSPPIVFITTFVALFFAVLCMIKDISDVEGDMKHNIRTFAAIIGPKNITFLGIGMLLVTYIGVIVAVICMPQAFNRYLVLPAHSIFTFALLFQAKKLDETNYTKEASEKFFLFLWKLLLLEFLLFPFI